MKHTICHFCHRKTYSKLGTHETCKRKSLDITLDRVLVVMDKNQHLIDMLEISEKEALRRYEEAVQVTINGNDQDEIEKAWVERRKMWAIINK